MRAIQVILRAPGEVIRVIASGPYQFSFTFCVLYHLLLTQKCTESYEKKRQTYICRCTKMDIHTRKP